MRMSSEYECAIFDFTAVISVVVLLSEVKMLPGNLTSMVRSHHYIPYLFRNYCEQAVYKDFGRGVQPHNSFQSKESTWMGSKAPFVLSCICAALGCSILVACMLLPSWLAVSTEMKFVTSLSVDYSCTDSIRQDSWYTQSVEMQFEKPRSQASNLTQLQLKETSSEKIKPSSVYLPLGVAKNTINKQKLHSFSSRVCPAQDWTSPQVATSKLHLEIRISKISCRAKNDELSRFAVLSKCNNFNGILRRLSSHESRGLLRNYPQNNLVSVVLCSHRSIMGFIALHKNFPDLRLQITDVFVMLHEISRNYPEVYSASDDSCFIFGSVECRVQECSCPCVLLRITNLVHRGCGSRRTIITTK